jgi:hypothetical protein
VWLWPTVGYAGSEDPVDNERNEHAEHVEHDEDSGARGGGHHDHKHGLAIFLGLTDEPGHGTEGTFGLEYAYRFAKHWSVGGLIDYAGGEQRNTVIAPAIFWKPVVGLYLLAAPGIELHNGRGEADDHHLFKAHDGSADKDEIYFVLRLGVGYTIHVAPRFAIAPTVNLDLVNGHEVWVYGVNFEVMF